MLRDKIEFRSKWMDPDFRRNPKTPLFCALCQRDLNPAGPMRFVMYELDRYEAIHSEDWEKARPIIIANRIPALADRAVIVEPVGMDCARNLGLEWSRETER